ncbi:MAG TPA: hypothetical protein VEA16_08845 [Vicinamibacterales bacterium]|nr:hypothetical protein [Vicinamibacterales bacterium]
MTANYVTADLTDDESYTDPLLVKGRATRMNVSVSAESGAAFRCRLERRFTNDADATWRLVDDTFTADTEEVIEIWGDGQTEYRIGTGESGFTSRKVSSVTVDAAGTGVTDAGCNIGFSGGGGSGATATARFKAVGTPTVGAAGSGYLIGDVLQLSGGTSTTAATITVSRVGAASAVTSAAGSGYSPSETITLTGGTFTSAAVLTITNTKLVSVELDNAGSGYVADEVITLSATGGTMTTPATIRVLTVGGSGEILTFSVQSGGVFTANSTSFSQASTTGAGTGASFDTPLFGVNVVSATTPGAYSVLPSNPVAQGSTSGTGTGATFTTTFGKVATYSLTTAGNYSVIPADAVATTGGTGSGATANVDWGILSITVTAGGSGYTSAPTVTFSAGSGAAATAVLIGHTVSVRLGF